MRAGYSRIAFGFLIIAAMATVWSTVPNRVYAAEGKIGVVNTQKIMSDSLAAKSIQTQLEKQRKIFQDEFSKLERELVDKEKSLVDLRGKISAEEFEKKGQEYKDEVLRIQKLEQQRKQALEQAVGVALNELRGKVFEIVNDIAEKEQYEMVVGNQNVMWSKKEMDITDAVMARLDKSLKQVDLKVGTN